VADDSLPSDEVIISKWEEASQKCRNLDAKLTVFRYDIFGGEQPKVTHGRLYYEAPGLGRYEISEDSSWASGDWERASEAIVWKNDETLLIQGGTKTCIRFSKEKLQSLPSGDGKQAGLLEKFGRYFALRFSSPRNTFPLLVDVRAADVRKQFDLAFERKGEEIRVKATPNKHSEQAEYSEIGIILDSKTFLPQAIRYCRSDSKDRTVYVLYDQSVNHRPDNRDEILAPDLSQLKVVDEK
jgi:hypothetical protein